MPRVSNTRMRNGRNITGKPAWPLVGCVCGLLAGLIFGPLGPAWAAGRSSAFGLNYGYAGEEPAPPAATSPEAPRPAPAAPAAPAPATQPPARPRATEPLLPAPEPTTEALEAQPTTPRVSPVSRSTASMPLVRLASLPNMFGDSFGLANQITIPDFGTSPPSPPTSEPLDYLKLIDAPAPGGGRRLKISENDKALPMDRVFFSYNHFDNALSIGGLDLPQRGLSVDRYTLGLEKTFLEGMGSVELRMPFGGGYHLATEDFGVEGGDVGNLGIILKWLLYRSPECVFGGGLGIDTPTAGDVAGRAGQSSFVFYNDAVHLSPWFGFLRAPSQRLFYQGFLQIDVPTNGNRVDFAGDRLGTVSDQTLMLIDLQAGYWLYRNPYAQVLNGLAGVVELHYTTTTQDADILLGDDGFQWLMVTNTENRLDILNLTIGVHVEMGLTTLSVGGVLPLSSGSNRMFDGEVQVFLNRRF